MNRALQASTYKNLLNCAGIRSSRCSSPGPSVTTPPRPGRRLDQARVQEPRMAQPPLALLEPEQRSMPDDRATADGGADANPIPPPLAISCATPPFGVTHCSE